MKLYPAERLNVGISAGAIVASFAIATPHFATSLAIGALLETLNFRLLHRAAEFLFGGVMVSGGTWMVVLALRLTLLCGAAAAAMWAGADPVALVLGLSLVMPATLVAAWWSRPEVVEHQPEAPLPPDDPSWDQYSVWHASERVADDDEEAQ